MTEQRLRLMLAEVTVSAIHIETGEWRTVTAGDRKKNGKYGSVRNALSAAIAKLESTPGPWRITAISTPMTILGDIEGRRNMPSQRSTWNETTIRKTHAKRGQRVESEYLRQVGRLDLLGGAA